MNIKELSSALRVSVSAMHKRLRKQMYSVDTYSMTEVRVVGLLYKKGPLLPSELADFTKVKPQSISQILKKLGNRNLIKKSPSKEDGRKIIVSLTSKGEKMVEQTRYERDEWLAHAIKNTLSEEEMKKLEDAIIILNKLAEAEEE